MPNNPTLDELLSDLKIAVRQDPNLPHREDIPRTTATWISGKDEVKAKIAEAIQNIIGVDEQVTWYGKVNENALHRNELRANQRDRAKIFVGEFLESSNDQDRQ